MQSHVRLLVLPLGLLIATVLVAGQIAAGCVFDWQDDCKRALGFGCPGGSGAGSGAGVTGSTSTGGGGSPECTSPADCSAVPAGRCSSLGTVTCIDHTCGVAHQAGPSPSQVYGDCETNWCDATGTLTMVPDAGNVFDNGNPCIPYTCVSGTLTHSNLPQDAQCIADGGTGYCEPSPYSSFTILTCAECNPNDQSTCVQVPGSVCVQGGKCLPAYCGDKMKDYDETDKDCGGPTCPPCGPALACAATRDCTTHVCINLKCVPGSCMDGQQNDMETDTDCGGLCNPCVDGLKCSQPSDCISNVCAPSGLGSDTCSPPSCYDGVMNGGETGIDCGGSDDGVMCPPCASGDAGI